MTINTWINNELVTIDVEAVWAETFAQWDALVETDIAAKIATAIVDVLKASQAPKPTKPAANTADMTDKQLFAHYKKTVLVEDLRWLLRFSMSDSLRARAEAISKPSKHDIACLRDAWRTEREYAERAAGIPHVGAERLEPSDVAA